MFDSALFYCKHREFKETVEQVVRSSQIVNLVEMLRKFKHQEEVSAVLDFIDEKMKVHTKIYTSEQISRGIRCRSIIIKKSLGVLSKYCSLSHLRREGYFQAFIYSNVYFFRYVHTWLVL